MPQDPTLTREVETPRPRSSGAAVVAVASLAMFTAVGASAFVVRVNLEQREQGAVYLGHPAPTAWVQGDPTDAADVRAAFIDAVRRGDDELALDWYSYLPAASAEAHELMPIRNSLAASYRDRQYARIAAELDVGDCEAVNDRLARLRQLLPDANAPVAMERCAPAQRAAPLRALHTGDGPATKKSPCVPVTFVNPRSR